jgi:hypothetical protein
MSEIFCEVCVYESAQAISEVGPHSYKRNQVRVTDLNDISSLCTSLNLPFFNVKSGGMHTPPVTKEYNIETFSPCSTPVSSIISHLTFPLTVLCGLFKRKEKEFARFELPAEMTMEVIS